MVQWMNGLVNKKLSELTSVEVLIYYNHLQVLEISIYSWKTQMQHLQ